MLHKRNLRCRSNKNPFRQSQSKIFEGLLTLSLCKNLYIDSSILKCESSVPGVSYCSKKEQITTASVCMNEEKATALISRILNTVTVFGLSSKSTSYKPQNRTGYPSFAILVSIVVIPLTFVLLMYSFFLKVHLGEWKRECTTTSFKYLCLQLNRLFVKGRSTSGMRRPASDSNIVDNAALHNSSNARSILGRVGVGAHSNYVKMEDSKVRPDPRNPQWRPQRDDDK